MVLSSEYEMINGRKVVKKHVATIHCSNKLSLLERKISNALLYNACPNLSNTLVHEISLDSLKQLLSIKTRNHQALKDALKTLITTIIEWNVLGENVPELDGWNASTILSSVSVQGRIIKYQYSELMKSLIIDPKIYGKINLMIQTRFKSSYALALYENCSRYRGLRYTKNFSFNEFRRLMGVEEGKYEIFRDFNRRVLAPSVNEINTCSDIRITPDIVRKGRKVASIKFILEERKMKRKFDVAINNDENSYKENKSEIKSIANQLSMRTEVLEAFFSLYGEERVRKAAHYIQSRSGFKNGQIKNVSGYLKKAIEENYCCDLNVLRKEPLGLSAESEKNAQICEIKEHYFVSYLPANLYKLFQTLPDEKKEAIKNDFIENGQSFHGRHALLVIEKGFDNHMLYTEGLSEFIYSQHKTLMGSILSLEDYINTKRKEEVLA